MDVPRLGAAELSELIGGQPAARAIDELERSARTILAADVFDYYRGGAREERTLAANRLAWDRYWLVPRVLRDVATVSTTVGVLGRELAVPLGIAPMAMQRLAHPDGELATARAAADAGALFVLSTSSQTPVEEIGRIPDLTFWFQLYPLADHAETDALVDRAVGAGAAAICLTVDIAPAAPGPRPRGGFTVPPEVEFAHHSRAPATERHLDWAAVYRLRRRIDVPFLLKGVLHPGDARLASEHGLDGVIVSNHGGRTLDGDLPTADALPDIVQAVGDGFAVLVDGGLRRGSDILRALALGARAVLVGRPLMWGLACAGEAGAGAVLEMLARELRDDAALAGVARLDQVPRDLVTRRVP